MIGTPGTVFWRSKSPKLYQSQAVVSGAPLDGPVLGTGDNMTEAKARETWPLDGPVLGTSDNA